MDFKSAAIFGSYISKDYAKDLFSLLGSYKDLSASEAASRLNLHIKTAQGFLEAMTELNILSREEVFEHKRPYYRYSLVKSEISIDLVLYSKEPFEKTDSALFKKIREKKNAKAKFTTARNNDYLSSVAIWTGKGRQQKERKINLTRAQGTFLINLPFPNAEYMSIADILLKATVDSEHTSEVLDIVNLLSDFGIIEFG
ncbi:MAG: hypothetical protein HN936_15295 [Bacteroidetes bacterium]|jgi:predicted transcriptional regulator|nr:hypothetical protein [Bacteroidota bacterium]MBT4400398.1 hypothetical protein [Bacteroidota bacterium]MBT4408290.1 hypothetical protein [Bacteroidota bacterium]MBT5425184.1 hypothetical protein [Bacteroidota bacterium]MBT7094612.1 hypothetical protein [Bacteroidota bacterium]